MYIVHIIKYEVHHYCVIISILLIMMGKNEEEREFYNCITVYKMVEICLKEQLAKQILYLFPTLMNQVNGEADHEVFGSNNAIYNAVHYRTSEITGAVFEDRTKYSNLVEAKNKETRRAYEKMEKFQRC